MTPPPFTAGFLDVATFPKNNRLVHSLALCLSRGTGENITALCQRAVAGHNPRAFQHTPPRLFPERGAQLYGLLTPNPGTNLPAHSNHYPAP